MSYVRRMTQQLSTDLVPEWTLGDRLRKARADDVRHGRALFSEPGQRLIQRKDVD